jgi:hypothetical protein
VHVSSCDRRGRSREAAAHTADRQGLRLVGGNEDNDLWVRMGSTDGEPWIESVWELDEDERAAIAAGGTIELRLYGTGTPPVSLAVGLSLERRRNALWRSE